MNYFECILLLLSLLYLSITIIIIIIFPLAWRSCQPSRTRSSMPTRHAESTHISEDKGRGFSPIPPAVPSSVFSFSIKEVLHQIQEGN